MVAGRAGHDSGRMTSDPRAASPFAVSVRSPEALLAALPYLLGFRPEHSAVLVWLAQGRLLLTQRLDLPDDDVDLARWVDIAWTHAAAPVADEIVVVLVGTAQECDGPAAALAERAAAQGIALRDVLRWEEERWWSLLCDDAECCPPAGREIDASIRDAVAAEFALLGRAPRTSRQEVEAELAVDEDRAREVAAVRSARPRARGREAWRDRCLAALLEYVVAEDQPVPEAREAAEHLAALGDIRVRDTVLWELCRADLGQLERALTRLQWLVRVAPAGRVAPVATTTALCAWLAGDGARAGMALERALADDPRYSLATLLAGSMTSGLPPSAWRETMATLSRRACRYGIDASERESEQSVGA